MVTKKSSFPFLDVLLLLFGNCYFLTTVLFVGDLLLTLAVVVALHRTPTIPRSEERPV